MLYEFIFENRVVIFFIIVLKLGFSIVSLEILELIIVYFFKIRV